MSTQSTTCEYEYPEEGEERVAEDVHEHHGDAHRPNHRMLVHPAPAAGRSGGRKRPGVSTSSTHPAPAGRAGPACLSAAASTAPTLAYPPGRALWETSNGRFGPRDFARDWQSRKRLHCSPTPAGSRRYPQQHALHFKPHPHGCCCAVSAVYPDRIRSGAYSSTALCARAVLCCMLVGACSMVACVSCTTRDACCMLPRVLGALLR